MREESVVAVCFFLCYNTSYTIQPAAGEPLLKKDP